MVIREIIKGEYRETLVLIAFGIILLSLLFSFFSLPIDGVIGTPNATVTSELTVGNVYPEVLNVSIDDGAASITLIGNQTRLVSCEALLRDYNNDSDFDTATARFFGNGSSYSGTPDNNEHYRNDSCDINRSFGTWNGFPDDDYHALANCTFSVEYYALPGEWNCTVWINDTNNWNATGSDNITMNELLSVGLPDIINFGTVNATYVSEENNTRVHNYGNVPIDLALSGYARTEGDGYAMNCTLGSLGAIPIEHEKYNVSVSQPGSLTLAETINYTNLTSAPVTEQFNLYYRTNDTETWAYNSTYWRIYVPIGVAGTCNGTIIFGAIRN